MNAEYNHCLVQPRLHNKDQELEMANKGSKKRRLSNGTDEDEDEHVPSKKTPVSKHGPNGLRSPSFSFTPHNKPAELYRKDLISAMKLADSEQLQNEAYLLISDPWRQDWERGVQVPVNDLAIINEPKVKETSEKCKTGDFKIPRKFLHAVPDESYRQGCHELTGMNQLSEQVVRYDLDDLDVSWLETVNNEREEMSLPLIHEWIMERIVEELENQCHKSMNEIIKSEEGFGIEYDEDVVCDVCRSPDSEDGNEMVFCDNCDICVHQACYGIQTIPEGSYLCRACALGIKPTCLLCPNLKGAMKSTRSGTKWAHVSCSLWIPEVSIGCVEKMEPITKISLIPTSRWTLVCCICKERAGACIQCSVKTCKTAFHVTCGFNSNMDMKTILDPGEKDGVKLRAFCPKHTKNGGQSGSDSPTSPKSPKSPRSPRSPRSSRKEMSKEEIASLRAKKIKEIEEEFGTFINVKETATALQVGDDMVDIVMVYWKLKRTANFNRPLLLPKTEEADRLEKQQEDSLVARMKMFVHLRQDLERVRNLCYMVNRREKMKRQFLKMQEKVFVAANAYLTDSKLNLSTREVQKTVKNYKECNAYLATNINPLPNLPPTLTNCSDLDSIATDDETSDHSGPILSRHSVTRRLTGFDKLDSDPLQSVSVKTDVSDTDVDIEADEPPILEKVDIGTRRRDTAKGMSVKEETETTDSKGKDPMPNLKPELSKPSIVKSKVLDKKTNVVNSKYDNTDNEPKSPKYKSVFESRESIGKQQSLKSTKVEKVRTKLIETKTKEDGVCKTKEDSISKTKESVTNRKGSINKTKEDSVIKRQEQSVDEAMEESVSKAKEQSVIKTKGAKISESVTVNIDKTNVEEKYIPTHKNSIETTKRHSNRIKHELIGLLTKPNLRIDENIKDKVQNRILKTRGKLKRINGVHDSNAQPLIDTFFSQCNSLANITRSRTSLRIEVNHVTPEKKTCDADTLGIFTTPCSSSASKKSDVSPTKCRKNSPLQIKHESGNKLDMDIYSLMHSPETRSFKRRIESGFELTVNKNIFSSTTKLIPSENYSAIPMLLSPDCLSLKRSLKETVNNSRSYRSQSPLSSDSSQSQCDSKEDTPKRITRSRQSDNDENSRDSNFSGRYSSRLKLTTSLIKAPNFKA